MTGGSIVGRYQAFPLAIDNISSIQLTDADTLSEAGIVTEIGSNLYRYTVENEPVILPPAELGLFKRESFAPFQYGTPILYPPNRVKDATFSFNGRTYSLPQNEPPNHLHGELCSRPWKVLAYGASDEDGAYVTSEFRITNHPDILSYFPHPLKITATHRLKEGELSLNVTIANEGFDEAPFAFGLHPYFAMPFNSGEEIELTVPAAAEWPVTNQAFVTGEPQVTELSRKLPKGISIHDYPVLGCSLLTLEEGHHVCKMSLNNRGLSIHYAFDKKFPFLVLFRPDWADGFSLEPYTCVTDAFNLPYPGAMTGAKGIRSGETVSFDTKMWVKKE